MNLFLFSQIMCFLLFLLFFPCFDAGVSRQNPAFCPLVFLLGSLGKPSEDRDIPKFNRSSGAPIDEMCNVDKHERWLRNQFLVMLNLVSFSCKKICREQRSVNYMLTPVPNNNNVQ
jgi:hypothetical protein